MPQSKRINKSETSSPPVPRASPEKSSRLRTKDNKERMTGFIATDKGQTAEDFKEIEARYQQLIQAVPAAIYTCDANGYIITYNKAAADLWGQEPEPGKDVWCGFWKAYHVDGTPMPQDESPMAIALKEGRELNNVEIVIERPDGQMRHIMPHPKPFVNAAGKIIGAVNMLIDITGPENIDERNRYFAAIIQSSDDAIISKTLDGIINSWNNSAERIFG